MPLRGDNPSQLFIPTGSFRYVTWPTCIHIQQDRPYFQLTETREGCELSHTESGHECHQRNAVSFQLRCAWIIIIESTREQIWHLSLGDRILYELQYIPNPQDHHFWELLCVTSAHFGLLSVTQNMASLTMLFRFHYMGFLKDRKGRLTMEPWQTANKVGRWP